MGLCERASAKYHLVLAPFEASRTNQPFLLAAARAHPASQQSVYCIGLCGKSASAHRRLPPEKAKRWIRADGFIFMYLFIYLSASGCVCCVVFARCGVGCWQPRVAEAMISISTGWPPRGAALGIEVICGDPLSRSISAWCVLGWAFCASAWRFQATRHDTPPRW